MIRDAIARSLAAMLVVALAACARADQPAAPAWGRIDDASAPLGRFTFVVERRPDDGHVAVPPGFPQIVRATVDGDGGRRDLPIEYAVDATSIAILLPAGGGPENVTVETAEQTRQFDDGRIVLTARDAKVEGTHAKLEEHPGNYRIGFWTNAADAVTWKRPLTRWGAYDVRLTYSSPSASGTEIEVVVGDTVLQGSLASTGSWYRYATLPLGRVVIPAAGDLPMAVRCTNMVGGAVMNLKAVVLTPTCEGAAPVQGDDGVVTLHGRDATVRGTMLRWEPAEAKQTLGFWTRANDAAEWTFTIRTPGTFDVEVMQGCGTGQGGSEMAIDLDRGRPGAAILAFTVEDTGGFQAFRERTVGRLTIDRGGEHTLHVQPKKIAHAAACDIRRIRLVPVDKP